MNNAGALKLKKKKIKARYHFKMISLSSLQIKQICFWRCYIDPNHCFDLLSFLSQ